jgi:hypothetical protein
MNIMLVYLESEKLDYHYYAELPKFTPFDNNWSLDYDGKERRVGKK